MSILSHLLIKNSQQSLKYNIELAINTLLNQEDNNGEIPLHIAAREGHIDFVQALINKGANQRLKTTRHVTALDIARDNNHTDIVGILEKAIEKSEDEQAIRAYVSIKF